MYDMYDDDEHTDLIEDGGVLVYGLFKLLGTCGGIMYIVHLLYS